MSTATAVVILDTVVWGEGPAVPRRFFQLNGALPTPGAAPAALPSA
jgi:hypothetical protein